MSVAKDNFYLATTATFKSCEIPKRKPDYISASGSKYWYCKSGVIRHSDHWDQVASCYWFCNSSCGFCKWGDFTPPSLLERSVNKYWHIDVRKPLPQGLCHVKYIKGIQLRYWLNKLDIDYVRALVGFRGGPFNNPKFDGYVIEAKDKAKIMDFVRERQAAKIDVFANSN
tara:strand:- start:1515 stop:2024 length:510 start_codon:yes stop_codon:yes gene_type:complete